ncbi:MAG: hypothetical protein N2504_02775 [candidate division WOR-3 bacterium]|nr:hypothetical protein [candidate division WOR-3 bacterium]MCX7947497.1 hypothetical protein [candidate division WOR-3 bacterium]MDW8150656.1 hypothetical protein [candidate division WOR-3 bacterium]
MFNLILVFLNLNSVNGFATSYGAYGFSTSFNIINRPNYILNAGFSNISYNGLIRNYINFDFHYKRGSFSFEIYGSFIGHESNFRREIITK